MRTARPDRFTMRRLRGDLPAVALLAALLVLLQLFTGGTALARGSTGADDASLCTSADAARTADPDRAGHGQECPCLSAGCCAVSAAGTLPVADAPAPVRPPLVLCDARSRSPAEPERRPLKLFARAGRGPPLGI